MVFGEYVLRSFTVDRHTHTHWRHEIWKPLMTDKYFVNSKDRKTKKTRLSKNPNTFRVVIILTPCSARNYRGIYCYTLYPYYYIIIGVLRTHLYNGSWSIIPGVAASTYYNIILYYIILQRLCTLHAARLPATKV